MADRSADARRGKSGEAHARAWLEGRGYRTVAANWRCPSGELDLVMLHGEELVFVEVKTRTGERFGRAAEAVTPAKQRKLLATAAWFASEHAEHEDRIWRIDIVAVTIDPRTGAARVDHIENAIVEA
jgi:putative endonuclease